MVVVFAVVAVVVRKVPHPGGVADSHPFCICSSLSETGDEHRPYNYLTRQRISISTHFRVFCTRNPATMPIVVGSDAAQTPSLFSVLSSIFEATTRGGAH